MERGPVSHRRRSTSTKLPPPDVILYDAAISGRLKTPVDSNGLVDTNALVALMKETVDPAYAWDSPEHSIHHLHWPANLYEQGGTDEEIAIKIRFREQNILKRDVPDTFHSWVHYTTIPPELPSFDVMHPAVTAADAITPIYTTVLLATKIARDPRIPDSKRAVRLSEEYDNYMLHLEKARSVPEEFRLIDTAAIEARSVEEMLEVSKHIGRRALHLIPALKRAIQPVAA